MLISPVNFNNNTLTQAKYSVKRNDNKSQMSFNGTKNVVELSTKNTYKKAPVGLAGAYGITFGNIGNKQVEEENDNAIDKFAAFAKKEAFIYAEIANALKKRAEESYQMLEKAAEEANDRYQKEQEEFGTNSGTCVLNDYDDSGKIIRKSTYTDGKISKIEEYTADNKVDSVEYDDGKPEYYIKGLKKTGTDESTMDFSIDFEDGKSAFKICKETKMMLDGRKIGLAVYFDEDNSMTVSRDIDICYSDDSCKKDVEMEYDTDGNLKTYRMGCEEQGTTNKQICLLEFNGDCVSLKFDNDDASTNAFEVDTDLYSTIYEYAQNNEKLLS